MTTYYTADRRNTLKANSTVETTPLNPLLNSNNLLNIKEVSFFGQSCLSAPYAAKILFSTELLLELIRKQFYPEKPSRYQSMFATESIENTLLFAANQRIKANFQINKLSDIPIYEISQDEKKCHKGDMNLLDLNQNTLSSYQQLHDYWLGKPSSNPFWEIVIPLPAKIGKLCEIPLK